jgi:hypothetical protein
MSKAVHINTFPVGLMHFVIPNDVIIECPCCSCRWGETMSLNCGHERAYCSSPDIWVWRVTVEWYWQEIQGEETCPSSSLSTTNPTWSHPGANPGLRGERPATNRLARSSWLLQRTLLTPLWLAFQNSCFHPYFSVTTNRLEDRVWGHFYRALRTSHNGGQQDTPF